MAESKGREPERFTVTEEPKQDSEITSIVGGFGIWQLRIILVICMWPIFMTFQYFNINFYAPREDHWCAPPGNGVFSNWSIDEWRNYSLPPDSKSPTGYSSCKMYNRSYSFLPGRYTLIGYKENLTEVDCKFGWDYDRSVFNHSLENEYDLVCGREALAKTGAAIFQVGVMVGSAVAGQVSDIYGRKKTMMGTLLLAIVAGITTAYLPYLSLIFFTRFIIACSHIGCFTSSYVLRVEYLDQKWRSIVGTIGMLTWGLGQVILAGLAYALPDWRKLQLLCTIPSIAFIAFWWFVPESVRWLMSKGRVEEAEKIVEEAVKVNKRNVQVNLRDVFNNEERSPEGKKTYIDLIKFKKLRKPTLILYYCWFTCGFSYYGIAFGTKSLGGDIFETFAIVGAGEIPACIISAIMLIRFGRRTAFSFFMMLGGLSCLGTAFFDKGVYHKDWPIVLLALVGKASFVADFMIIYIFTVEIFPTSVRNVGLGSASVCARIGSISAPYVDLLRLYHPVIPLVVYGGVGVTASLLSLMLPETKDKPLPQTFKQVK